MQTLISPHLFPFFPPPKTLLKPSQSLSPNSLSFPLQRKFALNSFSSDEFPVDDDSYLDAYAPKEKETEDEARRRNWIERGWAPWEEILSPEGQFARKSLNEGEEVALQDPESIEAFKMLRPSYRKKKMHQLGLTEDEYYAKQFEIKGEIPEPLKTQWAAPLVVRHVPPRDWPPRGWEVDIKELQFIREAHTLQAVRIDSDKIEKESSVNIDEMCLDRYKVFLKQYNQWVVANKDRLEKESYKYDQDYYPGRRKRGKDYKDGMYELPFFYPGQICAGKVTTLHLYQGAFVDIGGVCDGWVPIKGNDWYWLRHHIKVGMDVIVEILAKRDPHRFRFPIEMRFVDPNIDHLIFNRFEFPPIFHRDEDTNPDEIRRDSGRPPIPRKDPEVKIEDEPLISNHPYVNKLWQLHVAEQMIIDDVETNPDKYKGKKLADLTDDEEFDEENSVEYTEAYYKTTLLPKTILKTSVIELNLEAAFAERQYHNDLRRAAQEKGKKYKIDKLRRNIEMDEYDLLHWRRSYEEREALLRDISCRKALGLPLEEAGKYIDGKLLAKDTYDPTDPLYRFDYWGEPKNSEKSKQQRLADAHNKSIVGKGKVWYRISYESAMREQARREALGLSPNEYEEDDEGQGEDDDDEEDFDYSIFGTVDEEEGDNNTEQPVVVNGVSSRISDKGIFEN